jgi:hypothetical protein
MMSKNAVEELLEKAAEYGITSYELIKLKVIDQVSRTIATFIPNLFALVLIACVLLFLNLGIAIWVGEMMGNVFIGFFIVSGFHALIAIILRLFLYQRFKKIVCDYIIKQIFK